MVLLAVSVSPTFDGHHHATTQLLELCSLLWFLFIALVLRRLGYASQQVCLVQNKIVNDAQRHPAPTLEMETSDDDLIDLHPQGSVRDRTRRLEESNTQQPAPRPQKVTFKEPPLLKRSYTTPDASRSNRPQLNQITSNSEEFIQKTRSGLLDLTEKGKATLQQAGSSVSGFKERMLQRENSWNTLLWPSEPEQGRGSSSRNLSALNSDDEEQDDNRSPATHLGSQPESQLPESDRKEVSNYGDSLVQEMAKYR